jgi:8-oxo-dGTP pyrophosphatase MutT (NUDIX family)
MPHIHSGPGQHDLTVSMFIVRTDFDQPKAMLHMHKKFKKWMQFGGHVELDENVWDAVKHELLEETGYELSQLKLLQPKDRMHRVGKATLHPQPINVNTHLAGDDHYHTALDYAFVTDQTPKHEIGEDESQDIKFATIDEIRAMNEDEMYESNQDTFGYIFEVCLPSWDQVEASS